MDAEKHLFAYSVFYLFALFAVLVADRFLAMVRPEDEIIRKRQRERARVMALLLGGLRRAAVLHHHREDGNELVNTAVAQNRNGKTAVDHAS